MNNVNQAQPLTRESVENFVRSKLSGHRLTHTEGVVKTGETLLEVYPELADTPLIPACQLHDIGRAIPRKEQKSQAEKYRGKLDPFEQSIPGLWHAPAGAQMILEQWDLSADHPLPRAVAYHPTGIAPMSPLLCGLMIADYTEPNRKFPQAKAVRSEIGKQSLPELARTVIRNKIMHALSENHPVHPWSVEGYNELCA